ncbi:MAG TPA: CoA transferase [Ramlibacter sp.]|nr:CoA transferase [Ramlibacter sp.]
MAGALHGIRILDLSSVLMGPSATQMLAEMGADVIKVEPPSGDTTRGIGPGRTPSMGSNFLNMNRGKRSLALDLKHPGSRAVLRKLVEASDVLVHNIRPQAAARLGLAYEDVRAHNPRLVHCVLAGFGRAGPYAGQPAYDDLIQGLAALPALYEQCGDMPRYVPTPVADRVAGLNAVVAITAALLHRERTGEGQSVEVPMFEAVAHMVLSDHMFGRTHEPPLGSAGYNRVLSPARHPYRTADGWLCVLVYSDRQWQSFFALVGRADLAGDARFAGMRSRNDHIDELYGILAETLLTRTTAQWLEALRSVDIPAGPMNTLDTLLDDPHLHQSGFFRQAEHPSEGTLRTMRLPMTWSASQPDPPRAAPRLGEHGAEILRELGLHEGEIQALRASGVVTEPPPLSSTA